MIYSVDFVNMTEKLNPIAVSRYLLETGWEEILTKREYLRIFQYIDEGFYQVIIPYEKNLVDYKQAMYKAINEIAAKENRSLEQVMLYLLNPNTDILKIRLDKKEIESGNITFDDAIKMYENAKKLLAATALDIVHPNRYHQGRIDAAVNEFLLRCRFGQTEIGSYVISVVCPFAELDNNNQYQQLSIFSDEERCQKSFTRKVTKRLMKNISSVKQYIDNNKIDELVSNQLDDETISANFFEALNGLNLDAENVSVEFIAEWSPVAKNSDFKYNNVLLTHDYYEPIQNIIQRLKEETNKFTTIMGRVKKLESSPSVENRTTGKVTIVYLDENYKSKTLTAQLSKSDYDIAIKAHTTGQYVEIMGELIKTGKVLKILCHSFSIME